MFELRADKTKLRLCEREPLTSGSVNAYKVHFTFSDDWDGLERTAVFRAGKETASMLLDEAGACTIPWEVLQKPDVRLEAGVYGTRGLRMVLPTIWADLGYICTGAAPSGELYPPTPELWRQELDKKGDRLGYTEDGKLGLFSGEKPLSSVEVSGGGGAPWGIGHGLALQDGNLTVVTTDNFQGDNTLPMAASGVETIVGNIEVLLGTI